MANIYNNGLDKLMHSLNESNNIREYSDMLFDMIDEGLVAADQIAKDLIYWCSEDEIKRYMEVNDLISMDDEDLDEAYKNHPELSKKDGTASKLIVDNKDRFNAAKNKVEIYELAKSIFSEAGLDTKWTKTFLSNLSRSKDYKNALKYVYDVVLSADNQKVIK